jgi:hypothetical protein
MKLPNSTVNEIGSTSLGVSRSRSFLLAGELDIVRWPRAVTDFVERYALFIFAVAVAVAIVFWRLSRVRAILEAWAQENRVEIISRTHGLFRLGPFFFTLGHQVVYLLTVRDQYGIERKCWVRLGGVFTGLKDDKVETRWE